MEFIGVIAGKSGEAIVREVHKWNKAVAIVAGLPNEPGMNIAEAKCCTDLSNLECVLAFFQKHGVKKAIFATGHILAIELADYLEKKGIIINIVPEISRLCNNKYQLKKYIESIGLNTPNYCTINSNDDFDMFIDSLEFPIVVKSIKDYVPPQLVHNQQQLEMTSLELFKKEHTIMLEEYIQGNDCSVVVSNIGTNVNALAVLYWSKAKESRLEGFFESFSKPLDELLEKEVKSIAVKIVKSVKVLGLSRVDIIVKDRVPYILEINSVITSENSGKWYTISSRKKGVYTSNLIVENAMRIFSTQTGEVYTRNDDVMVFTDDDRNFIPHIDENYLFPDTVNEIEKFINQYELKLTKEELDLLKIFIGHINRENPDEVKNMCTARKKEIVDWAKLFLNRN